MISRFSVKKPYTVLVGVVLALVLGVVSFTRMTADLLPSISLPYVIVMTTYVGASPETVETVVTKPVEASMATVSNIESINSISSENYSMVSLEFAQTADMDSVSLEIREKLDQISGYWQDDLIGNPLIMKLNPDMMPVMIAAAGLEGKSVAEVSRYIQDVIVPELESIEGVASVSTTGLIEENVNVIIRQDKVDEVNARIRAAIDSQLDEAGQELADGKAELYGSMGGELDDSEGMAAKIENANRKNGAGGVKGICIGRPYHVRADDCSSFAVRKRCCDGTGRGRADGYHDRRLEGRLCGSGKCSFGLWYGRCGKTGGHRCL